MAERREMYELQDKFIGVYFVEAFSGTKRDSDEKWYQIAVSNGKDKEMGIWSSMELNALMNKIGITPGDKFQIKKTGYNAFTVQYDEKEYTAEPPPRAKGSGGSGGNRAFYKPIAPQAVVDLMEWCKDKGGDDWKTLFAGCCQVRAVPNFQAPGDDKAEKPEKSKAKNDDEDSLPF